MDNYTKRMVLLQGFGVLSNNTLTCGQEEPNHQSCGSLHHQWPTSSPELTELSSTVIFSVKGLFVWGEFFFPNLKVLGQKVTLQIVDYKAP